MTARLGSLLLTAVLAAGCGSSTEPPPPGTVSVTNNQFTPEDITVDVGDNVTWNWNSGGAGHSVLFNSAAGVPADIPVTTSGSIVRTFNTAGTFNYHCSVHGVAMSGSVIVQ